MARRWGVRWTRLDHYPKERAEAMGHLDFAIAEFLGMKMQAIEWHKRNPQSRVLPKPSNALRP